MVANKRVLQLAAFAIALLSSRAIAQTGKEPSPTPVAVIQFMVIDLTPASPEMTSEVIRRRAAADLKQLLKDVPSFEVLNRTPMLAQWPQVAQISITRSPPTTVRQFSVGRDGHVHQGDSDLGLKISVEGQWLQVDPDRAYLRLSIDHRYPLRRGTDEDNTGEVGRHVRLTERRVVANHQTIWLTLPRDSSDVKTLMRLIGVTVHRVGHYQSSSAVSTSPATAK